MERMDQDLNSQKLNAMFAAYRDAIPDPEAGTNFMPRLWSRIEAKRSFVYRLRKMSQVALAAALAACLLGGVLISPGAHGDARLAGTYVDVLADAHADESASLGGIRLDLLDGER